MHGFVVPEVLLHNSKADCMVTIVRLGCKNLSQTGLLSEIALPTTLFSSRKDASAPHSA